MLRPIAFAGTVGAYEKVDMALLETRLGAGFTGWAAEHGEPLLIHDANADPRGAHIPGTDEVDESMLVRADALRRAGHRRHHPVQARPRPVPHRGPGLLSILADQAATAVESARLLSRSAAPGGELRGCST